MSEVSVEELREFVRHTLEFEVEVYAVQGETKELIERTVAKNFSAGGGVGFASNHPDRYSVGQSVFLRICMPGTDEMNASMECMTRVAWIRPLQSGEAENQHVTIGVSMDGDISFEKSMHDQGSSDQNPGQQP